MKLCGAVLAALAVTASAQSIAWDYPAGEVTNVFFWIERSPDLVHWQTNITIQVRVKPDGKAAPFAFYRIGVDYRTNLHLLTNEAPAAPLARTAGSKRGKLKT